MALLEVQKLGKSYDGSEVLRDAGLAMDRGGILGLVGPTGSGKIPLFRLINLLERPTAGGALHLEGSILQRVLRRRWWL